MIGIVVVVVVVVVEIEIGFDLGFGFGLGVGGVVVGDRLADFQSLSLWLWDNHYHYAHRPCRSRERLQSRCLYTKC